MEKRRISFDLLVFDTLDELSNSEKALMQIAVEARENAYAPYSQFMVGAAILLANEEIVIGNNQEMPLTLLVYVQSGLLFSRQVQNIPKLK